MSALGMHTHFESCMPLVNECVDNVVQCRAWCLAGTVAEYCNDVVTTSVACKNNK